LPLKLKIKLLAAWSAYSMPIEYCRDWHLYDWWVQLCRNYIIILFQKMSELGVGVEPIHNDSRISAEGASNDQHQVQ